MKTCNEKRLREKWLMTDLQTAEISTVTLTTQTLAVNSNPLPAVVSIVPSFSFRASICSETGCRCSVAICCKLFNFIVFLLVFHFLSCF